MGGGGEGGRREGRRRVLIVVSSWVRGNQQCVFGRPPPLACTIFTSLRSIRCIAFLAESNGR